jgi:predicted TPR repeat methyltransferase
MINASTEIFEVERAYDLAASRYDGWKWQDFWRTHETPFALDQINGRPSATSNDRLLDLGCGTGSYLQATRERFRDSVGVDVSGEMLSIARRRSPSSRFVHGSIETFRSADQFDVILATRVISHFREWKPVFASVRRMLKQNGLFILTSVHSSHDYAATRLPTEKGAVSVSTYKHDERDLFDYLQQQGFRVPNYIEIEGDGRCGQTGASAVAPVGWAAALQLA